MRHDTTWFEDDPLNEEGFETVVMDGWFSFGVLLNQTNEDHVMKTIENVADMMTDLMNEDYVEKWFFLYEGSFMAVRFLSFDDEVIPKERKKGVIKDVVIKTLNKRGLNYQENSFATYKEKKGKLFNKETVGVFAEIMCATTALWVTKRKFKTNFSNYRFMERVGHCMFNILCGGYVHSIKDERYFLHQRAAERGRLLFDDEFEDYSVPRVQLKKYYEVPPKPAPTKEDYSKAESKILLMLAGAGIAWILVAVAWILWG